MLSKLSLKEAFASFIAILYVLSAFLAFKGLEDTELPISLVLFGSFGIPAIALAILAPKTHKILAALPPDANNKNAGYLKVGMLLLIIVALLVVFTAPASAQTIIHRTKNANIGFGRSSDVSANQYMEFCVNGQLVGNDMLPVGGYIDNGIQIKEWVNPDTLANKGNFAVRNSIFGLGKDGQFYVVSYEERNTLPAMKWAFQNGPLLVRDSVNVCGTSQSLFKRSGIGVKSDNTLVVIVSLTPLKFSEFADLFINEGCISAIFLDGGPYVGCADEKTTYGTMVPEATKIQFFNN